MEARRLTGLHDFVVPLSVHHEHMVWNELAFHFSGGKVVENRFTTLRIGGEGNLINVSEGSQGLNICMLRVC